MKFLSTESLAKEYTQRRVVDGVSIHVSPGEIVGLLGPNGAGKTTTFNMVVGIVRPDEGVCYSSRKRSRISHARTGSGGD